MKPGRHLPLLIGLGLAWPACHAGSLALCAQTNNALSASEQDRLIRVAAVAKAALEQSGRRIALVARSGLALERLGQRYSHAGLSLQASANGPWSVRQLYYACDEGRPRLFDQGLSGFLLGTHDPALGYLSLILMPDSHAAPLERAALDDGRALQLLGERYSANAYAFSERYQNCNQWLLELLAQAWAGASADEESRPRSRAQRWLRAQAYVPTRIDPGWHGLLWLAPLLPWLHNDDHPDADLQAGQYQVSLPASIADFVRAQVPAAERLELCHTAQHVVLRRGWAPIAAGCVAEPGDEVLSLE